MRRKPYPIQKITGGLDLSMDPILLADVRSPNLNCVRFHRGVLKKDLGYTAFLDAPGGQRPMLIDSYYQIDGTEYLVLVTSVSIWYYNAGVWTAIAEAAFTSSADNVFDTAIMNDNLIVSSKTDGLFDWDGTTWAALGGTPNKCKCMMPFYNYLVLGFINDSGTDLPHRIEWSDTGDPETWTGGNTGAFDLSDTVDFIVGFALLRDRLFCFKERSIWEILYVGGTDIFKARMVVDGVGTYAKDSIITLGDTLIFFGTDGVYSFDGLHIRSVGEQLFSLLYETGEKDVNASKLNRARAVYLEETGEYCLALPTAGSSDPDMIVKFNIIEESWSKRYQDVSCFGLYSASSTRTTWSSLGSGATEQWEDSEWDVPWKQQQLPPGAPTTLWAAPDGTILEDDRSVEETTERFVFETKDFIFEHAVRWVEVRFLCAGDSFDLAYSTDGGQTWTADETLTPNDLLFREVAYKKLNITSYQIRFRVRSYNGNIQIKWIEPWYIPRKRSVLTY